MFVARRCGGPGKWLISYLVIVHLSDFCSVIVACVSNGLLTILAVTHRIVPWAEAPTLLIVRHNITVFAVCGLKMWTENEQWCWSQTTICIRCICKNTDQTDPHKNSVEERSSWFRKIWPIKEIKIKKWDQHYADNKFGFWTWHWNFLS